MRLTEEEAAALGIIPPPKKKRNKYGAAKVHVDGIRFDSRAEAEFYESLKLLQRADEIAGFCRQARFVITESKDGRGAEYVCDFVIFENDGTYRIVDVKGVETDVFKLKKKSFAEKYPKLKLEVIK